MKKVVKCLCVSELAAVTAGRERESKWFIDKCAWPVNGDKIFGKFRRPVHRQTAVWLSQEVTLCWKTLQFKAGVQAWV